jgi:hypothetical protein
MMLQIFSNHPIDALDLPLPTALEICLIEARTLLASLHGDAVASIPLALGFLSFTELILEVDLVMSALTVGSLGGNAGSVPVMSHILLPAPPDHRPAREVSASGLALDLCRAPDAKAGAVSPCPDVGTQHPASRRPAIRMGDL